MLLTTSLAIVDTQSSSFKLIIACSVCPTCPSATPVFSTIEKKTLALLLALQKLEVYVGSTVYPVIVYTDHNPLSCAEYIIKTND